MQGIFNVSQHNLCGTSIFSFTNSFSKELPLTTSQTPTPYYLLRLEQTNSQNILSVINRIDDIESSNLSICDLPPLNLFGIPGGLGIYHVYKPTAAQIAKIKEAGIPLPKQAYYVPVHLMQEIGATFYPDINECPAAKLLYYPLKFNSTHYFAWVKEEGNEGVWVVEGANGRQVDTILKENIDEEHEGWTDLLKRVGAVFYKDPKDSEAAREELERLQQYKK